MLRRRLGAALLLIALIILLVFLVTASAGHSNLDTLLAGLAAAFVGWLLRRSARRERQPSRRFRTLRRVMGHPTPEEVEENHNAFS